MAERGPGLPLLALMGLLLLALVVTIVLDLVAHPRDLWTAATFLAGTLLGVTLDRARGQRRG